MKTYWDVSPYQLAYGTPPSDPVDVGTYSIPPAFRGTHWTEQTRAVIHGVNELGFEHAVAFDLEHSLGHSRFTVANHNGHTVWSETPLDWKPETR